MQRHHQADIKLYLIPSSTHSYAYFHKTLEGRHEPHSKKIHVSFGKLGYYVSFDYNEPINLKLDPLGKLESEHPIYHPKLKKFASGYFLSFVLKKGDHQWLAIIKDYKLIPEGFAFYEDDFGEEDI